MKYDWFYPVVKCGYADEDDYFGWMIVYRQYVRPKQIRGWNV